MNTGAFLDGDSKKLALALLGHHLVDCLGTDAHNLDARAPDYAAAKRAIEEAGFGETFAGIRKICGSCWKINLCRGKRPSPSKNSSDAIIERLFGEKRPVAIDVSRGRTRRKSCFARPIKSRARRFFAPCRRVCVFRLPNVKALFKIC